MAHQTNQGYLILARISGYTAFFANTELEHAQAIMSELLELVINRLMPTLAIQKMQTDSVFAYSADTHVKRGETVLELVEATYVAFREHSAGMYRQTTCTCAACRAVPTLDLSFIVHFGEYLFHHIAGSPDLIGLDVNLVTKHLPNNENAALKGCVLLTAQALDCMAISSEDMTGRVQRFPDIGEVKTYKLDLITYYTNLMNTRRIIVEPQNADILLTFDIPAPPTVVWDWHNNIDKRSLWVANTHWTQRKRSDGRTGVGTNNHCAHGKNTAIEKIIDWHPFDYFTIELDFQLKPPMTLTSTYYFTPTPDGTSLSIRSRINAPLPRWMKRLLSKEMVKRAGMRESFELLKGLIEQEMHQSSGEKAEAAAH